MTSSPPPLSPSPRWTSSAIRLLLLGCLMTLITHFPASYLNTSTNTAVHSIERWFNGSFTQRGYEMTFTKVSLLKSVMNSEWYAGQIFGSLISPFFCDNYGRKVAYATAMLGMTAAIVMQAVSVNSIYPELFFIGRLLASLCSPVCDNATVLYLQEMSPTSMRGTLFSLYSVGISVISNVGMVLGQEKVLGYSLPHLFLVPVVVGVLSSIFALVIPETPKYLVLIRGDKIGAMGSMSFFRGRGTDYDVELEEMEKEAGVDNGRSPMLEVLRTRRLRKALGLAIVGTAAAIPLFSILQSSTHYFVSIGMTASSAQQSSSLMSVALAASSIAATFLVDYFQRRRLVLVSGFVVALMLSLFVTAERLGLPYLGVAAFYGLIVAHGFGLGPIVWTMGAELVPTAYRSAVFAFMFACVNLITVFTNFLSTALFDAIGAVCFVPIFIVPILVAEAVLFIYLPETRHKETPQIYAELKRRHGKVAPMDAKIESDIAEINKSDLNDISGMH